MNAFYKQKNMHIYMHLVISKFQSSYRIFYCKHETISNTTRRESLETKWYWFGSLSDFGWIKISAKMVAFTQEHWTQRKYTALKNYVTQ